MDHSPQGKTLWGVRTDHGRAEGGLRHKIGGAVSPLVICPLCKARNGAALRLSVPSQERAVFRLSVLSPGTRPEHDR